MTTPDPTAPPDVKLGRFVAVWHVRGAYGRPEVSLHGPWRSHESVKLSNPTQVRALIRVLERALDWMESAP